MSIVTAIWTTRTGCACRNCRTQRYEYHATVQGGDGHENHIEIDEDDYNMLRECAGENDMYADSMTIFTEPVEYDFEPTDDEWYEELNAGYMRDIGARR